VCDSMVLKHVSGCQSIDVYYFYAISLCLSQDDVVMGTLTVRENLMFSANLRLPKSFSRAEKSDKVDDTIEELGLSACANTRVS